MLLRLSLSTALVLSCLTFWTPLQGVFLRDKEAALLIPLALAFLSAAPDLGFPKSFASRAGLLFLIWGLLSCLWSAVPAWTLASLLTLAAGPLIFWILEGRPILARRVLAWGLAASALAALLALAQLAHLDPLRARWSGNFDGRAFSTLGNPDYLGGQMLAAFFGSLLMAGMPGMILGGLHMAALLASGSRGPFLSLALGLALLWPLVHWGSLSKRAPGRLRTGLAAALLLGLGILVATVPGRRLLGGWNAGSFAVSSRMAHARTALRMIRDHPALGVGYGAFGREYPQAAAARAQTEPYHLSSHAHNEPLQAWAEGGPVALVLFLVWAWGWALVLYRQGLSRKDKGPALAGAGGLALAFYGLSNFPWSLPPTAALASAQAGAGNSTASPKAKASPWPGWAGAFLLCLAALSAARRLVPDIALHSALGFWAQGLGPQAESEARRILDLDAGRPEALRLMSEIAGRRGDGAQAESFLEKASVLEPGDLRNLLPLANQKGARGDHSGAEALFRKAVTLAPADPSANLGLATSLFGQNRLPEALAVLQQAVEKEEKSPELWNALGVVRGRLGLYPQSVEAFQRALALKRDFTAAAQALAQTEALARKAGR